MIAGHDYGRDDSDDPTALRRRRLIVAGTALTGSWLLGASFSTKPGSRQFSGLTLAVAATWTVGGLLSGPLRRGWARGHDRRPRRPVVAPMLIGGLAFSAFYGLALVARRIPLLNEAIARVLRYETHGSRRSIRAITLLNGAAEEVFFRGAMYAAAGENKPVLLSTAGYCLATVPTRNPALILASVVMGAVFGIQRRATGGIQAPMLTHLTWTALMLGFLPRLYDRARTHALPRHRRLR